MVKIVYNDNIEGRELKIRGNYSPNNWDEFMEVDTDTIQNQALVKLRCMHNNGTVEVWKDEYISIGYVNSYWCLPEWDKIKESSIVVIDLNKVQDMEPDAYLTLMEWDSRLEDTDEISFNDEMYYSRPYLVKDLHNDGVIIAGTDRDTYVPGDFIVVVGDTELGDWVAED